MSPELNILHVVHVASVVTLLAFTFYAFAAPPASRKLVMIVTGIATLLILATGIRMWQVMFSFALLGWLVVKSFCWVGLSGLAGMAYRRRDKTGLLMIVALLLAILAIAMVYLKPTLG